MTRVPAVLTVDLLLEVHQTLLNSVSYFLTELIGFKERVIHNRDIVRHDECNRIDEFLSQIGDIVPDRRDGPSLATKVRDEQEFDAVESPTGQVGILEGLASRVDHCKAADV
jgi:hypothetical protein